jgi:Tfp pilus assembly protein PilF
VFEQYAAVAIPGVAARVEFLGREGRTDEALDLLESRWDDLSLERALSLAVQVLRSQADETAAIAAAGRIGPWVEKAKRVDPGSIVILLLDAELRTLLGRESESQGIYRTLLARPDLQAGQKAIVANNLAFHLATPATAAEARKLIDSAIAELGPLPDLLDTRGLIRLAGGDPAGAVEDLREAALDPSAVKHLHLAVAELAGGDSAAARRALESARREGLGKLRLMPEDSERLRSLEQEFGPATDRRAAAGGS